MEFWVILAAYVVVVLAIGAWARRRAARSAGEYFLAGRSLATLPLFMALFGTNATPFVLVGIPGLAYSLGIGVFGLNAPMIALVVPLTFWAIGLPARRMGARLSAMTPAELYARRFDSRAVGLLLFLVFTLYTLPYMVTAVEGAAKTLTAVTDGAVPKWAGGLGVLVIALLYTSFGGMRATAWTNVLQGLVFLLFMVAMFFLVPAYLGGFSEATEQVQRLRPEQLEVSDKGLFQERAWASWTLAISLTVIAFPHMLVRLMAANDERSIKNICRIYPIAMTILFLPAVMLGFWGVAVMPGLEDQDKIFPEVITHVLPAWLSAVGFLAIIAAVMSTLDAQILTLGSMLTRDVLGPMVQKHSVDRDILWGRIFGVVVAAAVYGWWALASDSIFDIAAIAFSGYVTLVPTLFLGVRWRRFTRNGAVLSIVLGNLVYALALADSGWNARAAAWAGFLPVFWALLAAFAAGILGSLASRPDEAVTRRAFDAQ